MQQQDGPGPSPAPAASGPRLAAAQEGVSPGQGANLLQAAAATPQRRRAEVGPLDLHAARHCAPGV